MVCEDDYWLYDPLKIGASTDANVALRPKKIAKEVQFLKRNLELLRATASRPPYFGCFGMHEWAMVYQPVASLSLGLSLSESNQTVDAQATKLGINTFGCHEQRKQPHLRLRLSQCAVNAAVDCGPGRLRCSHFDAFRFFHPDAQRMNRNPTTGTGTGTNCSSSNSHWLSRSSQADSEQPGCIHANMDLFKYAYELYPCVSSPTLLACLKLALRARVVDMRASPYDVSHIPECAGALAVETAAGRMRYKSEQEAIYRESVPLREQLINDYTLALSHLVGPQLTNGTGTGTGTGTGSGNDCTRNSS